MSASDSSILFEVSSLTDSAPFDLQLQGYVCVVPSLSHGARNGTLVPMTLNIRTISLDS